MFAWLFDAKPRARNDSCPPALTDGLTERSPGTTVSSPEETATRPDVARTAYRPAARAGRSHVAANAPSPSAAVVQSVAPPTVTATGSPAGQPVPTRVTGSPGVAVRGLTSRVAVTMPSATTGSDADDHGPVQEASRARTR